MASSVLAIAYRKGSPELQRMKLALAALFVVLNFADVWTTVHALAQGGVEGNPVMAHIQGVAGMWWPVPKMASATAIAAFWTFLPVRFTAGALGVLCAAMGFIVWHNWTLIA